MGNDCFVVACKYNKIFLFFLVTKCNLTLVFHKGVNSIRADESSPLSHEMLAIFSNK